MSAELHINSFLPFNLIGLQSILESGYYYSKNIDSEYVDCSLNTAAALSLSSLKDIQGKTDQDFGWSAQRVNFIKSHDLEVINKKSAVFKIEPPFTLSNGNKFRLMSLKFPIIKHQKIMGVTGISFDINACGIVKSDHPILSAREQQCLEYYLNGNTAKETAKAMGLSYRTIEDYFTNIKKKLGCPNKRSLLTLFNI